MAFRQDIGIGPDGARRSALVVASDAVARSVCRLALEACNWEVEIVDSGVAAVVAARRDAPAIIIIGLQLRDVPGREALGWLRSNPDLDGVPVVVIAGGSEDDDEVGRLAANALLRRPVTQQAVRRVVDSVTGRPV